MVTFWEVPVLHPFFHLFLSSRFIHEHSELGHNKKSDFSNCGHNKTKWTFQIDYVVFQDFPCTPRPPPPCELSELGSYAEIGVSYQTLRSLEVSETVHRRIITKTSVTRRCCCIIKNRTFHVKSNVCLKCESTFARFIDFFRT